MKKRCFNKQNKRTRVFSLKISKLEEEKLKEEAKRFNKSASSLVRSGHLKKWV